MSFYVKPLNNIVMIEFTAYQKPSNSKSIIFQNGYFNIKGVGEIITGVCGYGYTGSDAVISLLREFNGTSVNWKMEFDITYLPDGLEDLDYHLNQDYSRNHGSDIAIKRFKEFYKNIDTPRSIYRSETNGMIFRLADEFLNELIEITWCGCGGYDFALASRLEHNIKFRILLNIIRFYEKVTHKALKIPPLRDLYMVSKNQQRYDTLAKEFIVKILRSMKLDFNKNIVLNQPFSADNPRNSFKYFMDPIAILVDRDPRDIFLLAKNVLFTSGRFIPTDNVDNFIEYFKILRSNQYNDENSDDIIQIRFEDLIYEYDRTVKFLSSKIDIGDHIRKKEFFDPYVSKENTQLFKRYKGYELEIKKIESELYDWLYPYENYAPFVPTKKTF